jgi:hypothetical protein
MMGNTQGHTPFNRQESAHWIIDVFSIQPKAGLVEPVKNLQDHTRTVSLTVQMPEALSFHNRYLEQRGHLYSQDFRAGLALGQCLLAE